MRRPIRERRAEPSTGRFIVRGSYRAVAFFLIALALDRLILHRSLNHVADAMVIGCLLSSFDSVALYRRPEWRKAVTPVHVIGLAAAMVALLTAATIASLARSPELSWWRAVGFALFFIAPGYLLMHAGRELLSRRGAGVRER